VFLRSAQRAVGRAGLALLGAITLLLLVPVAAVAFTRGTPPHGTVAGTPPQATATRAADGGLHCGMVVTRSVTLHEDLTGCTQDGLIVAGSGITINFAGHTLGGLGEGVGVRLADASGVRLIGGTVRGFELGMHIERTQGLRMVRMRVIRSADMGMRIIAASDSVFQRVALSGNSDLGMTFLDSHRNRLVQLKLGANGDAGIVLEASHGNRIVRPRLKGNGDVGILLARSNDNQLRRVRLSWNGDAGVRLIEANNNQLRGIRMVSNGDAGVQLESSHYNRIIGNRALGSSDSGIGLDHSSGNVVVGNLIRKNAEGITLDGGVGNTVLHNRISYNGGAGIEVAAGTSTSRIEHNRVHCNLGDGILVEQPELEVGQASATPTTVVRNTATCNGGMGIKVVAQGVFAPLNWAAKNSDDVGCVGVLCAPVAGKVRDCNQAEKKKKE
jgi:parallel beta-helix repeat protein